MNIKSLISIVFSAFVAAGCSTTTVVLVPDPNGKVGEVSITTEGGRQVLTQAGAAVEADGSSLAPREPETLDKGSIRELFGVVLDNEPLPPERHVLYFRFDTAQLRPKSRRQLGGIFESVGQRDSCDVSVIGHTDRVGDEGYNDNLSLRRAVRIKKKLQALGVEDRCMEVRFYGENDPLVPTRDGASEPRNRRVEVEIR